MTLIDTMLLNAVESLCRRFQALTGRTNVWLALQLTNLSVVVYFVWAALIFWRDIASRVVMGIFCASLMYLLTQTVFKDSIETHESNAYRRVAKGLRNPRRLRDAILRTSFLTLCIMLGYPVFFAYVKLLTTVILYLLACDPLPPAPAKLLEWFKKPATPELQEEGAELVGSLQLKRGGYRTCGKERTKEGNL